MSIWINQHPLDVLIVSHATWGYHKVALFPAQLGRDTHLQRICVANRSTQRKSSTQSRDTKITTCSTPFHLAIYYNHLPTNSLQMRVSTTVRPQIEKKTSLVIFWLVILHSHQNIFPPPPNFQAQSQKKTRFFGHLNLKKSCFGPLLESAASLS